MAASFVIYASPPYLFAISENRIVEILMDKPRSSTRRRSYVEREKTRLRRKIYLFHDGLGYAESTISKYLDYIRK
jgi:hypothetical protein